MRRLKIFSAVTIFLIFFSKKVNTAETDAFTMRGKAISDSGAIINLEVNRLLLEAAKIHNESNSSETCDQALFEELLNAKVGGQVIGSIESYMANLDKHGYPRPYYLHEPSPEDNIYSSRSFLDRITGVALTLYGVDPSILVGGQYIGTDKLGHFFSQGYEYHLLYKKNTSEKDIFGESKDPLDVILDYGIRTEEGFFGFQSTGVKSYADLSANYFGFTFWENIVHRWNNKDPFFKCEKGKWVQTRYFEIENYVSEAWDEGINCNEYKSPELEKRVKDRIRKLSKNDRENPCPVDSKSCINTRKIVGERVGKKILSPECFSINSGSSPEKYLPNTK